MKNTMVPIQLPTIKPNLLVRMEFDESHLSPEPEKPHKRENFICLYDSSSVLKKELKQKKKRRKLSKFRRTISIAYGEIRRRAGVGS